MLSRVLLLLTGAMITSTCAAQWHPHEVRLLNGTQPDIKVPAKLQIVTEPWNRVVAVPYVVYLPEKNRLLMLVGCDYPHHAEVLTSEDLGTTWSNPRATQVGGLGTSLTYLGKGEVLFLAANSRWVSQDYGETWHKHSDMDQTCDGKPWYVWDPLWIDRDAQSGETNRLFETGYTWHRPPEVKKAHQQGYIRLSDDKGATWSESIKVPQWKEVSEVALLRAANGDLVGACRTDIPPKWSNEWIDHFEGLGISISKDDGQTWSEVAQLYDWGRHHPSLVLLPNKRIVMTYVVRKGYVDTKDHFPQFGIEAIVSDDNGRTWDLDHRYILHVWQGNRTDVNKWWASCQATSTVLLPDGSLLTAFGTGYRSQSGPKNQPTPRDAGIIRWRLSDALLDGTRTVRDAPVDSDDRNVFNPDP